MQNDMFKPAVVSRKTRRRWLKDQLAKRQVVNTFSPGGGITADTAATESAAIWGSCPKAEFRDDPSKGVVLRGFGPNVPVFATTVSQSGYISLQDTGVTIQGDPTQAGMLHWGGQDADNDAGILSGDGNTGTSFMISDSDARKLWYEIRLKKSIVTDNSMGFFVGLAEEGMAAATNTLLATDSAALADKDFIGFHVDQADGDSIDFVYNKASAGGVTVKISGLSAMVLATFIKLGFVYDPQAQGSERIKIYVNGVMNSTKVTGTNIAAATFPDGEELTPVFAFKKGEATISTATVAWYECAQWLA